MMVVLSSKLLTSMVAVIARMHDEQVMARTRIIIGSPNLKPSGINHDVVACLSPLQIIVLMYLQFKIY